MSNERFYKIVIILLLLLNGGTLTYLYIGQNKGGQQQGPGMHRGGPNPVDRMMTERLQLTPEQEDAFRILKDEHHSQIMDIQQEEKQLHTDLFALLKTKDTDTTAKNALLSKLETNDRRKEEVTFEHFRKLREILTPEQDVRFDELVEEISSHIMSQHRPGGVPPPPPRD
jgi:protein CpxP